MLPIAVKVNTRCTAWIRRNQRAEYAFETVIEAARAEPDDAFDVDTHNLTDSDRT